MFFFLETLRDMISQVDLRIYIFCRGWFNHYYVVSNILYFHPYLGKILILTDIFKWVAQPPTRLARDSLWFLNMSDIFMKFFFFFRLDDWLMDIPSSSWWFQPCFSVGTNISQVGKNYGASRLAVSANKIHAAVKFYSKWKLPKSYIPSLKVETSSNHHLEDQPPLFWGPRGVFFPTRCSTEQRKKSCIYGILLPSYSCI